MPPEQNNRQESRCIVDIRNNLIVVPPPPSKFSINEWNLNNIVRNRVINDQSRLADSIIAESDRAIEQIDEKIALNKRETDHAIAEKIKEIEFNEEESKRQRKEVALELENLQLYTERIKSGLESVQKNALEIVKKCFIQRERRIGIDLCYDEVEKELKKEMRVIESVIMLLSRTLEQAVEQIRRIRSTFYFIDRDLEDKEKTKTIDSRNIHLSNKSMNLSIYHGASPLDPAQVTLEEWDKFTKKNLETAAKEIVGARQLRSYIDTLLKQAVEDLNAQYHATNGAFRRRIEEYKNVKTRMELHHSEIMRQTNEITLVMTRIRKAMAENEGYMALSHTRLGNRAQRPGVELCKDIVGMNLVKEVAELKENCNILQHKLTEAQASLRYLLKTQIQIEEDINIKTNSIKIDEVDCMTLRQGMDYHSY